MTEAPLAVLSVPDRFEIDGPFVARRGVIEVGYWLFPRARGRGLATQAVRAVARGHDGERIDATIFSLLADE